MKYAEIIEKMTLEDKVALCSGADDWNTKGFPAYGVPGVFLCDGPHGLRKQRIKAGSPNVKDSIEAVCFPTASLVAATWDPVLAETMGAALAEEMEAERVSVLLGPGVNIKRNPLCGRNFEYLSEDPYLAGKMAAAWIRGVQSKGRAACAKHFAANNQEALRMATDSIVDIRTLREIYFTAFEIAVKEGAPKTLMCSYNLINGVYSSDNRWLLTEVLRKEWGFSGLVMTDWGAMNDRVAAVKAGLDLEMPGSWGAFDQRLIEAIRDGLLPEAMLDQCVDHILELAFSCAYPEDGKEAAYDRAAHHQLAVKVAQEGAVLLKNEGHILPLKKDQRVAVIGLFAKEPRYQGAGSSYINTPEVTAITDALDMRSISYDFFEGYEPDGGMNMVLRSEAAAGAAQCDVAVIVAGLPEAMEGEGFDRDSLEMPVGHNLLIREVAKKNPNTIVLLMGGAPVEMPWVDEVKGILNLYLGGEGVGEAAVALLMGEANPSGKLAETYPLTYSDVPYGEMYGKQAHQALYAEGLYVGYRYYDTADRQVLFPFGHGLSYTSFSYRDLTLSFEDGCKGYASFYVKNIGEQDGAEVAQLYVASRCGGVYRPLKELKGFQKVFLKAGEEQKLILPLNERTFSYFNVQKNQWEVESGEYILLVGASSRDFRLAKRIQMTGEAPQKMSIAEWYYHPDGSPTKEAFETLYGSQIPAYVPATKGTYTLQNSLAEMKETSRLCRVIYQLLEWIVSKSAGIRADRGDPTFRMMVESAETNPLRTFALMQGKRITMYAVEGLVMVANGSVLQGVRRMLTRRKKDGRG